MWSESLRRSRSASPERPEDNVPHHELTPRTMADSYCEQNLRFASQPELFEKYTNTSGGIRTGKLMEHLDSLAGSIAYKHMLGPVEEIGNPVDLGFYLVTASVDRCVSLGHPVYPNISWTHAFRLDMLAYLSPVRDLRLSGHVIYVGKSSMEVAVRMEALNADGTEETVMLGKCCMSSRASSC